MLLARLFARRDSRSSSGWLGPAHRPAAKRCPVSRPPHVESLENRTLLSGWAIGVGGSASDAGKSIATDSSGNVYVTGSFQGTVDFDPGPGISNLTDAGAATDIFAAKYSPAGALIWAQRAGGSAATGETVMHVAVDSSGNTYIVGYFSGTSNFGSFNPTSAGGTDVFIAKLDTSGNFAWADSAGSTGTDVGLGVAVDGGGNVLVTGGFEATVDFDPGPGTSSLTSIGGRDIFALKLDTNGNFVWAQRAGGTDNEQGRGGAAVDTSGNAYIAGFFLSTQVDFGTTTLALAGSRDAFVAKLDGTTGNFVWAAATGGTGTASTTPIGIAVDGNGDVYTTGAFSGTVDFDPGPGSLNLTSSAAGNNNFFLWKLDTSGNLIRVRTFEGTYNASGYDVAVDSSGNAYTTGEFDTFPATGGTVTVDFDPGPGTAYLTGDQHTSFVSKLDSSGNFVAARVLGGNNGNGIAVDSSGSIYSTGDFGGTAYFDIGTSTANLISNSGSTDIFVVKTTQELPVTPQLSRLLDSPDPATKNGPLTLTASDVRVVAGGSNVASVSFYRDKNGNGTLEVGTDTLLGTDTNGSNGWSLTTTAPNKNGITTYFAQAKDSSNVAGNVVSARNRVGPGGPVASMISSRDRAAASVDLVLDRHYSDDREDRDGTTSRSHLNGRSLAELLRTRSRR